MIKCNQSGHRYDRSINAGSKSQGGKKKKQLLKFSKLDAVFEEKLVKKQQNSAKNIEENRKNSSFPIKGNF